MQYLYATEKCSFADMRSYKRTCERPSYYLSDRGYCKQHHTYNKYASTKRAQKETDHFPAGGVESWPKSIPEFKPEFKPELVPEPAPAKITAGSDYDDMVASVIEYITANTNLTATANLTTNEPTVATTIATTNVDSDSDCGLRIATDSESESESETGVVSDFKQKPLITQHTQHYANEFIVISDASDDDGPGTSRRGITNGPKHIAKKKRTQHRARKHTHTQSRTHANKRRC
jgi:hypothetical protein